MTALPIEVLVHIFSYSSISDFLELSHVHPIIRDAFKANAAQICNLAIEHDPELRERAYSARVNAKLVKKWLIPARFPIMVDFTLAQRILRKKSLARLGTPGVAHKYEAYFLTDEDLQADRNRFGKVDLLWNK